MTKIISFSDLHLEFGANIKAPPQNCADIMVLAGDIIPFRVFDRLGSFLENWEKPVLYVPGNHEYYTRQPMGKGIALAQKWLARNAPNARLLLDEDITLNGTNFFGGTMWTDFNGADPVAMDTAARGMNDYRMIYTSPSDLLEPLDTLVFHGRFVANLIKWFETDLNGPRVVISHHAPVQKTNSRHEGSSLMPAFDSLDMLEVIKKYQPDLWIYGHTHECADQTIGKTRILSNQLGYPMHSGHFECADFDFEGKPVEV